MRSTTINDVKLLEFKTHVEDSGGLVAIESLRDIPISIARIFYVFNASGKTRGNHAHFRTHQVLMCPHGELTVTCNDGINSVDYTLSKPNEALFIPEMIWDSTIYKTSDTILLAISDTKYEPEDYICDFDEFVKLKVATWRIDCQIKNGEML